MRTPLVVLLALLIAAVSSAAVTESAMTGRVLVDGKPRAGVHVRVTSPALLEERGTTTASDGSFLIGSLPPGRYEVTFSGRGLQTLARPAVVELGRVARADARLESSEDEDSVTSTATTIGVADTTAVTTHFSDASLDRFPLRGRFEAPRLAPGGAPSLLFVDDAPLATALLFGEEALEQMTVLRAGIPAEIESIDGPVVVARTRSGGEELFLSIRDTYSSAQESGHLFESASGGRIVPGRLWFFAAGWAGDAADRNVRRLRGINLKATAQVAAAHNVSVTYFDADSRSFESKAVTGRYSGSFGPALAADVTLTRADSGTILVDDDSVLTAQLSTRIGPHNIAGGVSSWMDRDYDALFVSDRFAHGRFTLDAGARHERDRFSPRVAATFALTADGRYAVAASYGKYVAPMLDAPATRLVSFGLATAFGTSGSARIDYVRRDREDQVQLDARYRLFDRFEAGTTFSHDSHEDRGQGWLGADIPIGEHELGATLLERYVRGDFTTDLAVRYTLPLLRTRLTLAGDVLNAFDDRALERRTWRMWARVRM